MKKLIVSKRVDLISDYQERRDAIDQQWSPFLMTCGFFPIYTANSLNYTQLLLKEFDFSGVILTGGNDLGKYGGDSPERDEVEHYLIEYAIANKLPVIGICRGMQVIQDYFNVPLEKINHHVGTLIELESNPLTPYHSILSKIEKVKAYHQWGTKESNAALEICAQSKDGIVMAIKHVEHNLFGQMWHPERHLPFNHNDIALFTHIINT